MRGRGCLGCGYRFDGPYVKVELQAEDGAVVVEALRHADESGHVQAKVVDR